MWRQDYAIADPPLAWICRQALFALARSAWIYWAEVIFYPSYYEIFSPAPSPPRHTFPRRGGHPQDSPLRDFAHVLNRHKEKFPVRSFAHCDSNSAPKRVLDPRKQSVIRLAESVQDTGATDQITNCRRHYVLH